MKTDFIYRQFAWLYDYTFKILLREGHVVTRSELAKQAHLDDKPLRVAELGVGPGHSFAYYPDGTELTGIDVSAEMIRLARKRVKAFPHLNTKLEVMDAMNTTLPSEAYDIVISFSVVTVVERPEKLLAEACRLCRPGGKIIIVGRLKRAGLADQLWRTVANPLTLFLFGFKMTLDEEVYRSIDSQVKLIERKRINHVGPLALSDMLIFEKKSQ